MREAVRERSRWLLFALDDFRNSVPVFLFLFSSILFFLLTFLLSPCLFLVRLCFSPTCKRLIPSALTTFCMVFGFVCGMP